MKEALLKVSLIEHTPMPENLVALSARLCYSPVGVDELREKMSEEEKEKLINLLRESGHLSPFEHASFTFAVEGISRACSHQLVRHRIASYSQQSQRYVSEESGFDFVVPPIFKEDNLLNTLFKEAMEQSHKYYCKLLKELEKRGIKGETARQDARFVLPNAAETKIVITMNARELLHFFRVRCCSRAQWEIRALATEMLRLVKKVAPLLFKDAGPSCVVGKCPEGRFSCGKAGQIRKKFKTL
ncbi:FAD-dependent thymidylate synthase [Thermodesulfovibrio sp.]|uniref:FAD-dependent thymidylate synthase n=1 Tax=Thermodesulfovibrio TaxID=28261 RepID=UPI00261EA652|nr:FAD-dependent thymidylate synthase [Thermodesulfovibrio sp.]